MDPQSIPVFTGPQACGIALIAAGMGAGLMYSITHILAEWRALNAHQHSDMEEQ